MTHALSLTEERKVGRFFNRSTKRSGTKTAMYAETKLWECTLNGSVVTAVVRQDGISSL